VDLFLAADPDVVVSALRSALRADLGVRKPEGVAPRPGATDMAPAAGSVRVEDLAVALRHAVADRPTSLLHLPLSWPGAAWPFRHPLDDLGADGGGGIGAGPGISVGAALALKAGGRLPVAICGDGDFLMGATALWAATHYRVPLLLLVANNRSFFDDEVHQERVARLRGRPVENKWIGQRLSDPEIDIAGIARSQGAVGPGPVERCGDLTPAFVEAIAAVDDGRVAVVDVHVQPAYTPAMGVTQPGAAG
jgi:thiamine pyrophosphate-dependent acetolactate synthase large subunit-like protein